VSEPTAGPSVDELLAQFRATVSELTDQRDSYKKAYELVMLELERLRRGLFGRKAEKVDPAQIALVFEPFRKLLEEQAQKGNETATDNEAAGAGGKGDGPPAKKKAAPHGRRNLAELDDVPVEEIRLVPADLPVGAVELGAETSYRIEWKRGQWVRLRIVRPRFVVPSTPEQKETTASETTVVVADAPDEMVPRGLAGPAMLAHVLVSKFADHLPFHRQEDILARHGIELDRGTMCRWADRCHELARRVVDAMAIEARETANVIATDATGVLVQAKEQCRRGHFWVCIADEDHVFFRYTPRHSSDGPKTFLAGFSGYVQADASSVYDALFRQDHGPTEVGCWSHARRKFFEAIRSDKDRALVGLGFANELFAIDRPLKDAPPARRLAVRRARAGPVVAALRAWKDELLGSGALEPRAPLTRALGYLDRHWVALTRFLDDGRLRLSNNWSELELRHLVVGRRNWLFVGSDEGAEATCTFVSLVASAQLHHLEPETYLRDLFRVLPAWPQDRLLELSPRYWAKTRERLALTALAAPLGPLQVPPRVEEATHQGEAR
jgi:transposase